MYYKNNDINMYYEVYGKNNYNKVLILPGWGETRKTFYDLINSLKEKFKVYIVDYPGFGNTKFPNKDLDIYDYAILIRNFMNDNKIINPVIIAHSFGGRISIILNGLYKVKIRKMILIDIAGIRRKSLKRYIRQKIYKLRKKMVYFLPREKRIKNLNKLRKEYGSSDYNNLDKNMYQTFKNVINEDLRKHVKSITSKTLLLWGFKDTSTPIKDGYYLNKRIKESHLIIFPNGTHFVYLEYKNEICNIIQKYI